MKKLSILLCLLLAGCVPMAEMLQNAGQPTAQTVSTTDRNIEEYQLEPYNGPKARVAVYRFTDRTAKGKAVVYGYHGYGWYSPQIGNGMADMLNDALLQSNRFIVLDRQGLKDVLQEQDLARNGRVSQETAAPIGEVEGADLLIKGSVTEFEPGSAGSRVGVGAGAFGLPGAILGGVLNGLRQSHVAMVVQVVDARTSRLLFSTTVEGKANDFDIGGFLAGFGGGFGAGAGLGMWQKTPVEKAIRIAILQAVRELSSKTPKTYFRHGAEAAAPASPLSTGQAQPKIPNPVVQQLSNQPMKISSPGTATSVLPSSVRVKVSAANLRDAPDVKGKIVTSLKEGSKLAILGEDKGWYFVQTDDRKEGWISRSLTAQ